jgi:hypothetical protein
MSHFRRQPCQYVMLVWLAIGIDEISGRRGVIAEVFEAFRRRHV